MYSPSTILSENRKTGCSLNMPIKGHCRPTKNCSRTCYARSGHTALPSNLRKQNWLSEYLKGRDISQLIQECRDHTAVRLSGTGDLQTQHVPNILKLARACPATMFWGMTRKLEIAKALNGHYPNLKIMVSVDSSSPEAVWNYQGTLCWGPRLATDKVPKAYKRIRTIFPYHRSGKIVQVKSMPQDKRDCPAVRHTKNGCLDCGRCWNWN
jgi:hypothetical protein